MPREKIIDTEAIEKNNRSINETNEKLIKDNELLTNQSDNLQSKIKVQQKEILAFDKKIQETRAFLETEEGKKWAIGTIGELNAEINRLREVYGQTKTECQSIDDEKVRKSSEFKVFCDSQTAELQLKKNELDIDIKEKSDELAVLISKNEEQSKANTALSETNGKLSTENTLLEQRKILLIDEIKFLEGQKEGVKTAIETKLLEQDKIEQNLSVINQEIVIKKNELEELKKEIINTNKEKEIAKQKHLEILKRSSNLLEREAQSIELRKYIRNKYEKIGEPWDDTNN